MEMNNGLAARNVNPRHCVFANPPGVYTGSAHVTLVTGAAGSDGVERGERTLQPIGDILLQIRCICADDLLIMQL